MADIRSEESNSEKHKIVMRLRIIIKGVTLRG
jgi:hypothetical protein